MELPKLILTINYYNKDYRPYVFARALQLGGFHLLFSFGTLLVFFIIASHYITEDLPNELRLMAVVLLFFIPLGHTIFWFIHINGMTKSVVKSFNGQTIEFSEQGIVKTGGYQTTNVDWGHFQGVTEYPDRFFMSSRPRAGENIITFVPKRWFESDEKLQLFRDLVEKGITKAAGERSSKIENQK